MRGRKLRRAHVIRAEDLDLKIVAKRLQVAGDDIDAESEVAGDVFKEAPSRPEYGDEIGDAGPEIAGVVETAPVARGAEGLAGVSADDAFDAKPRFGVEGVEIAPDRRISEGLLRPFASPVPRLK